MNKIIFGVFLSLLANISTYGMDGGNKIDHMDMSGNRNKMGGMKPARPPEKQSKTWEKKLIHSGQKQNMQNSDDSETEPMDKEEFFKQYDKYKNSTPDIGNGGNNVNPQMVNNQNIMNNWNSQMVYNQNIINNWNLPMPYNPNGMNNWNSQMPYNPNGMYNWNPQMMYNPNGMYNWNLLMPYNPNGMNTWNHQMQYSQTGMNNANPQMMYNQNIMNNGQYGSGSLTKPINEEITANMGGIRGLARYETSKCKFNFRGDDKNWLNEIWRFCPYLGFEQNSYFAGMNNVALYVVPGSVKNTYPGTKDGCSYITPEALLNRVKVPLVYRLDMGGIEGFSEPIKNKYKDKVSHFDEFTREDKVLYFDEVADIVVRGGGYSTKLLRLKVKKMELAPVGIVNQETDLDTFVRRYNVIENVIWKACAFGLVEKDYVFKFKSRASAGGVGMFLNEFIPYLIKEKEEPCSDEFCQYLAEYIMAGEIYAAGCFSKTISIVASEKGLLAKTYGLQGIFTKCKEYHEKVNKICYTIEKFYKKEMFNLDEVYKRAKQRIEFCKDYVIKKGVVKDSRAYYTKIVFYKTNLDIIDMFFDSDSIKLEKNVKCDTVYTQLLDDIESGKIAVEAYLGLSKDKEEVKSIYTGQPEIIAAMADWLRGQDKLLSFDEEKYKNNVL